MVTLDKIKIKVPLDVITGEGRLKPDVPFHIRVTRLIHCAYIEFGAKILLDRYPELINRDNFNRCLDLVSRFTGFHLNIPRIISEGEIVKCDFTKDMPLASIAGIDSDFKKIKTLLVLCNCNNQLYPCSAYRNGSIAVNKAVQTLRSRFRLIIYDKEKEMRRKKNLPFLAELIDANALLEYFEGKIRFELNAYTSTQIKHWLNILDTHVLTVLCAETNALVNALQEVFLPVNISEERIKQSDQDKIALLKGYNWDMTSVEANVREHNPHNWTRSMAKYRELCMRYNPDLHEIRQLNIAEWVS